MRRRRHWMFTGIPGFPITPEQAYEIHARWLWGSIGNLLRTIAAGRRDNVNLGRYWSGYIVDRGWMQRLMEVEQVWPVPTDDEVWVDPWV